MSNVVARQARRARLIFEILGVFLLLYFSTFLFHNRLGTDGQIRAWERPKTRPVRHLFKSLSLDAEKCDTTFPGLTQDIDNVVASGPFTLKQAGGMGPIQLRLTDGQLYVIHSQDKDIVDLEIFNRRAAALQQLHRAIVTSPTPLPDTILSISVRDEAVNDTWSHSRPAYTSPLPGNEPVSRVFLMPHFSFWGWPLPWIGSFSRVESAIEDLEVSLPFSKKDPRIVWRGTKRFNNDHYPHLRDNLLKVTKGASWADVEELLWDEIGTGTDKKLVTVNSLMAEDFCRYKYVLHTEGISYSGRFQLLQMCNSVLLAPPIVWLQHTTHLAKPLFSSDLGHVGESRNWALSEYTQKVWPVHYKAEEANIVFVNPDWSDLGHTIRWLEEHPDVAEGIAKRQKALFATGGYFSPAAEACYWRALIRGWNKVVRTPGKEWEEDQRLGVPLELFLMGYDKWP